MLQRAGDAYRVYRARVDTHTHVYTRTVIDEKAQPRRRAVFNVGVCLRVTNTLGQPSRRLSIVVVVRVGGRKRGRLRFELKEERRVE